MKLVKSISLFFICPILLFSLGFFVGASYVRFFGLNAGYERMYGERKDPADVPGTPDTGTGDDAFADREPFESDAEGTDALYEEVSAKPETLCVETQYVLEEKDVYGNTTLETTRKLPQKYIGMDREQFLAAMEVYQSFPPLSEQERGFVGLEVLSFSRERVVVQMNYKYVKSDGNFYLMVYNNEVVVYLEDKQTVYIETGIQLDALPEELQHEIINVLFIEKQEDLYDFLETYSS